MKRREMLAATGAAMALQAFSLRWVSSAEGKRQKVLYFTRSVEYEHSVVHRQGNELSHSERILTQWGREVGFDVECSKDGTLFDRDFSHYDALIFYTCGDMFKPSVDKAPAMTPEGKKRLVEAIAAGQPFIGVHSACYWGRGIRAEDPCVEMVGGNFVAHGKQQQSTMQVTSPKFPGAKGLETFKLVDEWYALRDFAKNMHCILAQDSTGMQGAMYQRPPFPSTWARLHGKGRVFFTAMGHREDVWTNQTFRQILLGGIAWAMGNVDADITPNVEVVTPEADKF